MPFRHCFAPCDSFPFFSKRSQHQNWPGPKSAHDPKYRRQQQRSATGTRNGSLQQRSATKSATLRRTVQPDNRPPCRVHAVHSRDLGGRVDRLSNFPRHALRVDGPRTRRRGPIIESRITMLDASSIWKPCARSSVMANASFCTALQCVVPVLERLLCLLGIAIETNQTFLLTVTAK